MRKLLAGVIRAIQKIVPTNRIDSVTRISLDLELQRQFRRLQPGVVFDVGAGRSPYKKIIPHTKYLTADIDPASGADIIGDFHQLAVESNLFDTVVAIEVLEHLYAPQHAVDEIRRVLKPGGVCILSTRFLFYLHGSPHDYYRFTDDGLKYLFRDFSSIEVVHHGNRLQTLWQIIAAGKISRIFLSVLNPLIARINVRETRYASGYIVIAVK